MNIQENVPLAKYTTLGIGGLARYFVEITNKAELKEAIAWAAGKGVEYTVIAGGSNLLVADEGYDGMVIKINVEKISLDKDADTDKRRVIVGAGTKLQELVDFANEHGLGGIEKMAGIPGSVGGAIYGNAGAYGQTISDKITRVRVLDVDKDEEVWIGKEECGFGYRDSSFKKSKTNQNLSSTNVADHSLREWKTNQNLSSTSYRNLIILEAEFEFEKSDPEILRQTSEDVLKKRLEKYPRDLRCPGSFFKNLLASELPEKFVRQIPVDYYGKMPAGYFLDLAGAKGDRRGKIKIADYHANLFFNEGGGRALDFFELAREWKKKVKEKFGIELEPEVQLVGFKEEF